MAPRRPCLSPSQAACGTCSTPQRCAPSRRVLVLTVDHRAALLLRAAPRICRRDLQDNEEFARREAAPRAVARDPSPCGAGRGVNRVLRPVFGGRV